MDIKELMGIDIDNLAEKQFYALKEHTIGILKNIINLLEEENFIEIPNMLSYSPSGDGYGCDNYFINFSYDEQFTADLYDRIDELIRLKNIIENN